MYIVEHSKLDLDALAMETNADLQTDEGFSAAYEAYSFRAISRRGAAPSGLAAARRCHRDGRHQRRRSGVDRCWLRLPIGRQVRRGGGCAGEDRPADGCLAAPGHPEIPLPGGPSQRLRRRRQALGRALGVRRGYPAAHRRMFGGRGPHRQVQLGHRQRTRPGVRRLGRREEGAREHLLLLRHDVRPGRWPVGRRYVVRRTMSQAWSRASGQRNLCQMPKRTFKKLTLAPDEFGHRNPTWIDAERVHVGKARHVSWAPCIISCCTKDACAFQTMPPALLSLGCFEMV